MGFEPRDPTVVDTLAEWRPFLLAAREARLQELHWTLDPLDFQLVGSVRRPKRGRLWTYVHVRTGRDLSVDDDGVPHEVRLDRAMRIRTKEIPMRSAVWRTGVPAEELEREPAHRATHEGWEECEACQAWEDEQDALYRPTPRRRSAVPATQPDPVASRRHLRAVR